MDHECWWSRVWIGSWRANSSRHRIADIFLPHMNLVLGSRLPFYLLFAMENELFRDSTIKNRKIRAALDAQIDGFESMINFYMCPRLFDILNVVMVTVWFTSAEICFMIWLLKNSCERPVWYHGNGFHWCFVRSCPELTPSKFREYWEHWWFRGRKNRIYDNYHSCLCSHIPGDMSHKTQACNRATQFSLTNLKARCQIHKFEWQAWRIVQRIYTKWHGMWYWSLKHGAKVKRFG